MAHLYLTQPLYSYIGIITIIVLNNITMYGHTVSKLIHLQTEVDDNNSPNYIQSFLDFTSHLYFLSSFMQSYNTHIHSMANLYYST